MTDNDIIKALECCWHEKECIGNECPLFKPINDCAPLIAMEALDLINRQKAEIERLNVEARTVDKRLEALDKPLTEIRSEAIKEFAERLEEEAYGNDLYDRDAYGVQAVTLEDIDQIAKELKGKEI